MEFDIKQITNKKLGMYSFNRGESFFQATGATFAQA